MMYERLVLMKDLLSDDGSLYLHCDWRVNSLLRLVLDEIFGKHNFRNEIVWSYGGRGGKSISNQFARNHDNIIFYTRGDIQTFNKQKIRRLCPFDEAKSKGYKEDAEGRWFKTSPRGHYTDKSIEELDKEGRIYRTNSNSIRIKYFLKSTKHGVVDPLVVGDVWSDIPDMMHVKKSERTDYPTQKPEELLERIIKASSKEGDIVCDFFGGSGTTAAVSEKLNRKWICADLGKFAIHTTRKRIIEIQRDSKTKGTSYRPFELLNLGKYQREYFIYDSNQHSRLNQIKRLEKEKQFERLVLQAYEAQSIKNYRTFSGKRNLRMVSIGPVHQPTSRLQVEEIIKECIAHKITKVDLLAFEYEMGLFPGIREDASDRGIDMEFKKIPNEVFDKRAVNNKDVQFYDVSYIEAKPIIKGNALSIELSDFVPFHNLDNLEKTTNSLKSGKSKVIVVAGKIIKVSKDKSGVVKEETLTKKWCDWVDYWSVDFDFENRKELIRVKNEKTNHWEQKWTGNYIFDNEWQSFRTKSNPTLELTTPPHTIEKEFAKVAVKVVDIFGNDTLKVINVKMK